MKRNIQILLIFAFLAPLFCGADEETMEERKRRITRKYLRERMEITYSEDVVPSDQAEQEDVLASEKYREPKVDLEAEEPGLQLPPPMQRPMPKTENRNWLLSEPLDLENPYADPFSRKETEAEAKKSDGPIWDTEREPSSYLDLERDNPFRRSSYGTLPERQPFGRYEAAPAAGVYSPRPLVGERAQEFRQPASGTPWSPVTPDEAQTGTFNPSAAPTRFQNPNQQTGGTSPQDQAFGSVLKPRTSGDTPYKSPFETPREQQQWGGYTPYKSPYQTQYEQRRQQWDNSGESTQEFRRQDSFQQWKTRNPAPVNPMSDNAFVEEMMPKSRR